MTTNHRVLSIETHNRPPQHLVIVCVSTAGDAAGCEREWSVRTVLKAMDRAERFYSQAPNGRRARVQRYNCSGCHKEHIRTHISDGAIHDLIHLGRSGVAVGGSFSS